MERIKYIIKFILLIYLGLACFALFCVVLMFPVIIADYTQNYNYFYLFLVNIPLIIGFVVGMFNYIGIEDANSRPKRD